MSGQNGSSAAAMPSRLLFLFVQMLLLPNETTRDGTGNNLYVKNTMDSACEVVMTKALPSSFCNFTWGSHVFNCWVSWTGIWYVGSPRGTSTSPSEATKAGRIDDLVSGQVSSCAATVPNRILFLFVQVRLKVNDYFCYRSDDRFLLLPPCPHVLMSYVKTCTIGFFISAPLLRRRN